MRKDGRDLADLIWGIGTFRVAHLPYLMVLTSKSEKAASFYRFIEKGGVED